MDLKRQWKVAPGLVNVMPSVYGLTEEVFVLPSSVIKSSSAPSGVGLEKALALPMPS